MLALYLRAMKKTIRGCISGGKYPDLIFQVITLVANVDATGAGQCWRQSAS